MYDVSAEVIPESAPTFPAVDVVSAVLVMLLGVAGTTVGITTGCATGLGAGVEVCVDVECEDVPDELDEPLDELGLAACEPATAAWVAADVAGLGAGELECEVLVCVEGLDVDDELECEVFECVEGLDAGFDEDEELDGFLAAAAPAAAPAEAPEDFLPPASLTMVLVLLSAILTPYFTV